MGTKAVIPTILRLLSLLTTSLAVAIELGLTLAPRLGIDLAVLTIIGIPSVVLLVIGQGFLLLACMLEPINPKNPGPHGHATLSVLGPWILVGFTILVKEYIPIGFHPLVFPTLVLMTTILLMVSLKTEGKPRLLVVLALGILILGLGLTWFSTPISRVLGWELGTKYYWLLGLAISLHGMGTKGTAKDVA